MQEYKKDYPTYRSVILDQAVNVLEFSNRKQANETCTRLF